MNKMIILNLSLWMSFMFDYLYRMQVITGTDEIIRSRYSDTLPVSNNVLYTLITKGVLRTKTRPFNATWGLPKCREIYGDGNPIVSVSIIKRGYTTSVMLSEWKVDQLDWDNKTNLWIKGLFDDIKYTSLYKRLQEPQNLKNVYNFISRKKGTNTKGFEDITLDRYSNETIKTLSESIKDHSFIFKPIRRIYIPKKDGSKRSLSIPGLRDKVVQKAATIELENIFENIFDENSHGFRPKRGTHTALKQISGWTGIKWFIVGDISTYFDTIDHYFLIDILKKYINDKEFIDFIWKAIRVNYVNVLNKDVKYGEIGTLSTILSNIYLHALDIFMKKKVDESKLTGPIGRDNFEYKKINIKISKRRQIFSENYRFNMDHNFNIEEEKKQKINILGGGHRIYYVRYVDNFLIGVNGSYKVAVELMNELKFFLQTELKLELNMNKTKIISALNGSVDFLGAHIRISSCCMNDQKRRFVSYNKINKILILAPLERITQILMQYDFCWIKNFSKREVIPKRKVAWMNLEAYVIIQNYNKIWRGILNYYSFAYNRSQLIFIQYLIQHSAACTLMNKLKISSRAKIFKKFGYYISVPYTYKEGNISLDLHLSLKRISKFSIDPKLPYEN